MAEIRTPWPHAPTHQLCVRGTYFFTASWVNKLDQAPGRQVWFNFRETRLTYQRSYLARLHYVHQNPVKHGLVRVANQYPWCSAGWFEREASSARVKSIYRFKVDSLQVADDFEVAAEW